MESRDWILELLTLLFSHDAFDQQFRIEEERQRFEIQERPTFEIIPIGQQDP